MDPATPWLRQLAATLVFSLTLCIATAPAAAKTDSGGVAQEGGTGVGAMLVTLVYAPIKLVYATGGLVLAGLTWVWTGGDSYTAGRIARKAVGGDYVVTPSHLEQSRGEGFTFAGDH